MHSKSNNARAAYVERIQQRFHDYGEANPAAQEMGTTLTCAYLMPPHVVIVQIGDSRAYLYRKGELTQLTKDQTLAQLLMDEGVDHEHANSFGHVLLNSLGCNVQNVESEILHLEMQHDDRLLLCTDGLNDMVDDESIAKIMSGKVLDASSQNLIDKALANGGRDNVTVVIGELLDRGQTLTREFKARESPSVQA